MTSLDNTFSFPVDGYCDPRFNSVKQAFEENLAKRNEVGASVSVVHNGQLMVDLWGGFQDVALSHLWEKDTLVCVMSATKAVASLCILVLADRNIIQLDATVASYWPEFAQQGKEKITIRCLLSQLAGIPVADAAPAGSLYEPGVVADALAKQKPLWEPGSTPCYHSFTHGPLCQKIIELTTGKTMGSFLREDLFAPFDIEFLVGLNADESKRCADIILSQAIPSFEKMKQSQTLMGRAWKPLPKTENFFQDEKFRTIEFASGNGHSNARAMAKLYGILAQGGQQDGKRMISESMLQDAITEQWDAVEQITNRHFRYGTGFMLNNQHFTTGPNPRSFGHPGLGGAIAFADPDARLGFGYCGNRIHAIDDTGPCAEALIAAVYESLSDTSGDVSKVK